MNLKQNILASCALLALSGAAIAQTGPAQPSPRSTDCTPTQPSPDSNSVTTTGRSGEALGDKLARSDGVLCPPAGVDSEIHTPAPDIGKMPVIPPPGSPGGDPGIRPK